jgi:hypothetical protein
VLEYLSGIKRFRILGLTGTLIANRVVDIANLSLGMKFLKRYSNIEFWKNPNKSEIDLYMNNYVVRRTIVQMGMNLKPKIILNEKTDMSEIILRPYAEVVASLPKIINLLQASRGDFSLQALAKATYQRALMSMRVMNAAPLAWGLSILLTTLSSISGTLKYLSNEDPTPRLKKSNKNKRKDDDDIVDDYDDDNVGLNEYYDDDLADFIVNDEDDDDNNEDEKDDEDEEDDEDDNSNNNSNSGKKQKNIVEEENFIEEEIEEEDIYSTDAIKERMFENMSRMISLRNEYMNDLNHEGTINLQQILSNEVLINIESELQNLDLTNLIDCKVLSKKINALHSQLSNKQCTILNNVKDELIEQDEKLIRIFSLIEEFRHEGPIVVCSCFLRSLYTIQGFFKKKVLNLNYLKVN